MFSCVTALWHFVYLIFKIYKQSTWLHNNCTACYERVFECKEEKNSFIDYFVYHFDFNDIFKNSSNKQRKKIDNIDFGYCMRTGCGIKNVNKRNSRLKEIFPWRTYYMSIDRQPIKVQKYIIHV